MAESDDLTQEESNALVDAENQKIRERHALKRRLHFTLETLLGDRRARVDMEKSMEASEDFKINHDQVDLRLVCARYTDVSTLLIMLAGQTIILNRQEMNELSDWLNEQRKKHEDRLS